MSLVGEKTETFWLYNRDGSLMGNNVQSPYGEESTTLVTPNEAGMTIKVYSSEGERPFIQLFDAGARPENDQPQQPSKIYLPPEFGVLAAICRVSSILEDPVLQAQRGDFLMINHRLNSKNEPISLYLAVAGTPFSLHWNFTNHQSFRATMAHGGVLNKNFI